MNFNAKYRKKKQELIIFSAETSKSENLNNRPDVENIMAEHIGLFDIKKIMPVMPLLWGYKNNLSVSMKDNSLEIVSITKVVLIF